MNDISIDIITHEWPRIEQSIRRYSEDFRICVQAGGHHGLYPKKLSTMFNTVYTFEPFEHNYNLLRSNCIESNIIHRNAALGAYPKKVAMQVTQSNNSGNVIVAEGQDVDVVTIDSLLLPHCGLIQLDIEKYEMFALMGAIKTIELYRPLIIIEGPETTNNVCIHILEQLGYRVVDRAGYDTVLKYMNAPKPFCEYKPI